MLITTRNYLSFKGCRKTSALEFFKCKRRKILSVHYVFLRMRMWLKTKNTAPTTAPLFSCRRNDSIIVLITKICYTVFKKTPAHYENGS